MCGGHPCESYGDDKEVGFVDMETQTLYTLLRTEMKHQWQEMPEDLKAAYESWIKVLCFFSTPEFRQQFYAQPHLPKREHPLEWGNYYTLEDTGHITIFKGMGDIHAAMPPLESLDSMEIHWIQFEILNASGSLVRKGEGIRDGEGYRPDFAGLNPGRYNLVWRFTNEPHKRRHRVEPVQEVNMTVTIEEKVER